MIQASSVIWVPDSLLPNLSFSDISRKERTKIVRKQNFWGLSAILNLQILFELYAEVNLMLHAPYYVGVTHIKELWPLWQFYRSQCFLYCNSIDTALDWMILKVFSKRNSMIL